MVSKSQDSQCNSNTTFGWKDDVKESGNICEGWSSMDYIKSDLGSDIEWVCTIAILYQPIEDYDEEE